LPLCGKWHKKIKGVSILSGRSLANAKTKSTKELVMKPLARKKKSWGIAMTEYLIILAIVAIAAIAVVGLFGKQIKDVFFRTTSTLGGTDASGGNASTITGAASTAASSTENMSTFDSAKNSGQ
jgi:Flp pilus assembly pilin Flp